MGTNATSKRPSNTAARHPGRRRRALEQGDEGDAFVADVVRGEGFLWGDAEADAEEFIASVTSAGGTGEDSRNEFVSEEVGGPFLIFPADGDSRPSSRERVSSRLR